MLPAATSQDNGTRNGRGGSQRAGLPYLKAENLTFEKKPAKVLAVKINEAGKNKFSDVVLKVMYSGALYLFGLKISNPNYAILLDCWGPNDKTWIDKEFLVFLEQDEFDNRNWVRIEVPKSGKARQQ